MNSADSAGLRVSSPVGSGETVIDVVPTSARRCVRGDAERDQRIPLCRQVLIVCRTSRIRHKQLRRTLSAAGIPGLAAFQRAGLMGIDSLSDLGTRFVGLRRPRVVPLEVPIGIVIQSVNLAIASPGHKRCGTYKSPRCPKYKLYIASSAVTQGRVPGATEAIDAVQTTAK